MTDISFKFVKLYKTLFQYVGIYLTKNTISICLCEGMSRAER